MNRLAQSQWDIIELKVAANRPADDVHHMHASGMGIGDGGAGKWTAAATASFFLC
jgi:hypothetical protein